MTEMSKREIEKFLIGGTFTAKLATVKKDGSPHVVPIWFVLDSHAQKELDKALSSFIKIDSLLV